MRNLVTSTLWISLLLAAACSKEEPPPTPTDPTPINWQPPVVQTIPSGVTYTDMARRAGIDFVHYNAASAAKLLPETMGAGVAVIEFEPGDVRLLFIQGELWEGQDRPPEGEPTMRLYKRTGKWQFKDVTKESGLDVPCNGMGARQRLVVGVCEDRQKRRPAQIIQWRRHVRRCTRRDDGLWPVASRPRRVPRPCGRGRSAPRRDSVRCCGRAPARLGARRPARRASRRSRQ